MKANELMVGDYLTFHDVQNDSTCPKLRVIVINEEDVYVSNDGDPVADLCDPKDLAGIPITPEILENNGFTYVGKKVWQWEEKPFWVWWEEENHHLGIEIDDSSYDEEKSKTIMIIVQNFVHELQHALRLCGIDKEIEL